METSGMLKLKLPPGFRFHPTDEELVVQYLRKKAFDYPLPASIIPEADVRRSDPWDLPGGEEEMKYFFSEKSESRNSCNRATISGHWKATGIDKKIVSSKMNDVVGMKKTLVFYRGRAPHCERTNWKMHEYRLAKGSSDAQNDKWVVCRIFLKMKGRKIPNGLMNLVRAKGNPPPVFHDFLRKTMGSDASDCSGITQVSSGIESDDSDLNSTCDSSLHCRKSS